MHFHCRDGLGYIGLLGHFAGGRELCLPDRFGIVADVAGGGVELGELALGAGDGATDVVEGDRAGAGGALVEGDNDTIGVHVRHVCGGRPATDVAGLSEIERRQKSPAFAPSSEIGHRNRTPKIGHRNLDARQSPAPRSRCPIATHASNTATAPWR